MTPSPYINALVVDDSVSMRKQLCYALQRLVGIHTEEAVDGADGWRKVVGGSFDIVLTDINMPLMDGLKLVSLVRSQGPRRQIPIVVITTEGADADRDRAMSLGANAYLVKPVQSQQVVHTVKRLLKLE